MESGLVKQKYPKGTRVKVSIGQKCWSASPENIFGGKLVGQTKNGLFLFDVNPKLTEDFATVEYTYGEMSEVDWKYSKGDDGYKRYSLNFDQYGSIAWFDEEDIVSEEELINKL